METDEIMTAQTSEESTETVEQVEEQVGDAETDEQQTEAEESTGINDTEFDEGAEPTKLEEPPKKEPQSKERNAEEARKRREAERQEALKQARVDAILEATDGKNPFTGEKMEDADDVEEYLNMRQLKKQGKDPIADYASFMKQQAKDRKTEQEAKAQKEMQVRNDLDSFRKAHPDVNTNDLFNDEAFADYAEGKLGSKSLSEIYDGYNKLIGKAKQVEHEKAAQALANSKASPGAVSSNQPPETTFFTRDQVSKMSREQISKNYENIRKSMSKW